MLTRFNTGSDNRSGSGMLAGVCSSLAGRLGWNVWAIRAVLLILLIAEPLFTALGYVAAALLLRLINRGGTTLSGKSEQRQESAAELQSPELASRRKRIDDLEQRFRDWERSLPKD